MSNLASMVDKEIALFRSLQEEINRLGSDEQTLMSQHAENEMVKEELDLIPAEEGSDGEAHAVYKKVGPVLMKHDLSDAKMTVEKRLEFISGEIQKVEEKLKEKQKKAQEVARKVQEMQQ